MAIRARKINQLNVERSIRRIAQEEVAKVAPRIKDKMQRELGKEMRMAMTDSLVAQELRGGNLQGELGITNPDQKINAIANELEKSVKVEVKQVRGGIRRFFPLLRATTIRNDFRELLALQEAYQEWTDSKGVTIKGPPLPWLEWLLFEGRKTIIRGAELITGRATGRSGLPYVMSSRKPLGTWKVPPEHTGTATNNFLTRNLDARVPELRKRFTAIVNNAIRGLRAKR